MLSSVVKYEGVSIPSFDIFFGCHLLLANSLIANCILSLLLGFLVHSRLFSDKVYFLGTGPLWLRDKPALSRRHNIVHAEPILPRGAVVGTRLPAAWANIWPR